MLVVVLVVVLISIVLYANYDFGYLKGVPGPRKNVLFGDILDFAFRDSVAIFKQFNAYVRRFGGIVYVKPSIFKQALIVSDAKLIEYFLSSNKLIDKSEQYAYFHNWLGSGLLTSTGTKWRQRRKVITPSFHFTILEQFLEVFHKYSDVFVEKLQEFEGQQSFDVYPLVSLYTLDVICETAMGTSVNALSNDQSTYIKNVKWMCDLMLKRTVSAVPDCIYWLTPSAFQEKKSLKVLHSYTDSVIDQRIQSRKSFTGKLDEFGRKHRLAFLDTLLDCTIDGRALSKEELREEVDTFMFEGHDTTASAITFALYSLSSNPEVQDKVLQEQKQILGEFFCQEHSCTLSELAEMKYLELVIKETLRLYPSVPSIGRQINEEFTYNGAVYPKNTSVMLFIYALQRNSEYFSEPDRFIPERFQEIDGKNPFHFVPFSAGPRNCIGQKFAMLEMKSVLSKIVRTFEVMPSQPEHLLQLASETILISKNGVRIALRKRV